MSPLPGPIANGANRPINVQTGTVPDVSGALRDWFQPMIFSPVTKTTTGFQVVETDTPISFQGILMPLTGRQLQLLPEGQRAWTWYDLFADPALTLQVDDVVDYIGTATRVMGRMRFALYGYVQYRLVQNWQDGL